MIKKKAFVLRTLRFGDSDLIIHALSSDGEKLKLFARAALKSTKRFGGGVLQPTHFVSLSYKEARDIEGLHTLQEAQLVEDFERLRQDYDRLQTALHFVSLVDRLSLEGMLDSKGLFDLLGNALQAAQVATRLELLRTQFDLKLLHFQGVLPFLEGAEPLLENTIRQTNSIEIAQEDLQRLSAQAEGLLMHYLN